MSSWSAFDFFSMEKRRSLCSVGLLSGTLLSLLSRCPTPSSVPPPRLGAPHWITSPLTSADPQHPSEGHPDREALFAPSASDTSRQPPVRHPLTGRFHTLGPDALLALGGSGAQAGPLPALVPSSSLPVGTF